MLKIRTCQCCYAAVEVLHHSCETVTVRVAGLLNQTLNGETQLNGSDRGIRETTEMYHYDICYCICSLMPFSFTPLVVILDMEQLLNMTYELIGAFCKAGFFSSWSDEQNCIFF